MPITNLPMPPMMGFLRIKQWLEALNNAGSAYNPGSPGNIGATAAGNGAFLDLTALTAFRGRYSVISGTSTNLSATSFCTIYTNTAARTVNLPALSTVIATTQGVTNGQIYVIKDGAGNAGTNNITINRAGSDTIDGATSTVINSNFGVKILIATNVGWFVISNS